MTPSGQVLPPMPWQRLRSAKFILSLMAGTPVFQAGANAEPTPFVVSHDGAYVISVQSQLAWARCVEGMSWNGKTCAGRARLMTFAQATARAAERSKAEGLEWRLPSVLELQRLANKSDNSPSADTTLFPRAPQEWHWTSTSNVKSVGMNQYNYENVEAGRTFTQSPELGLLSGWAVNMSSGEAKTDVPKRNKMPVRLVWQIKPN